jgi:transcriptional regulator with XRE-family HTH domain
MSLPAARVSGTPWVLPGYHSLMSSREMFADLVAGYRKQAGLTQEQAAQKLSVSLSTLKKIEQKQLRPQRDFAQRYDELFRTPGVFLRIHEELVSEPFPEWFGPRVVYEDKATAIIEWEQRGVPGLLQTEAYARSVIKACRPYDPPEAIERDMRARLERQEIFQREVPPRYWAIIGEGPLRQRVGGKEVMAGQLDHLIRASESSWAVVQVLPFSAEDAPGADGPAVLFEFSDSTKVAYLEGWEAGRIVENPPDIAVIETALNVLKGCALSPADSRKLLREIRDAHGK